MKKAGTAGEDWVQLSDKALVNVGTASDGTLIFTDSLNNPLSASQSAAISEKINFDLNQLSIFKDENGMVQVSTPSGEVISSANGFTSDYLKNQQAETNEKKGSVFGTYFKTALDTTKNISANINK